MNEAIERTLLHNWHPMRWVALSVGIFFVGMGIWHVDTVSVLLGGFFLFQAVTNTGCLCGSCAMPAQETVESGSKNIENVEFTEIKED